ncbi:flavin reductase family protein [Bacillus sp. 2205SS5-2]|uniref:flavin reductase family protein n=1 Tax=Bacillus sp. 2205SS5-2 TaxID=3109031 RepID=UPI0030061484
MEITPDNLAWQDAYKLLIGSIVPRPIAFVSTIDTDGVANLAPYSFFTAICADPMLICFSPMRRGNDGEKKDTLRNIEKLKEFVINIVSEEFTEKMNDTAKEFAQNVDEFEMVGLTKLPSKTVKPFRVQESKVQLECILHEVLHFGDTPGAGSLVIGKVQHVHVLDELFHQGRIDTELLKPIGRLAGQVFTNPLADTFELVRKR